MSRDHHRESGAVPSQRALRAGEVIRRLRAMFKRGESNRQLLDLNELAGEVLGFAHSDLLNRHVQVTTRLGADLPKVRGDNIQLQQVLLNLIVNACEAMTANAPLDTIVEITAVTDDPVLLGGLDAGLLQVREVLLSSLRG